MAGYVIPLVWGFVVLAAFVGWGGVVARLFGGATPERPDWGLAAGWGMAASLAVGGALALVGLARPWLLAALVVAGAALFVRDLVARPPPRLRDPSLWAPLALVVAVLLVRYAKAVAYPSTSCSDDGIAYFALIARLLDTGTLIDPFSLRRITALGGQTFLQGLAMIFSDVERGGLLDRGIALIVIFGLVVGYFREPGRSGADGLRPAHCLMALALTAILPLPVLNTSSHFSGLALFLTLFRTLERLPPDATGAAPAQLWLAGLVASGAASLKVTTTAMAAAVLVAWWLIGVWRDRRGWSRHGLAAWHLSGSTLTFLAPWMALLFRSSGTPLFPLVQGNHRPGFAETYSGELPLAEYATFIGKFLVMPEVALFLVPVVLYAFGRGGRAGLAVYAGAIAVSVATAATLTHGSLRDLHRYVAPFLNAAFIATAAHFFDEALRADAAPTRFDGRRYRSASAALWLMAAVLLPVPIARDVVVVAANWAREPLTRESRAAYARLQSAVPAGEKLLVLVDDPFVLDYRRNRIINVDVPGAVSPDPGMPFFQGPAPLKEYLLAQSIRHVAFRDFSAPGDCLYGRDRWRYYASGDTPIWRAHAKYYLDLMENVEALAAGGRVLRRERGLTVIALD